MLILGNFLIAIATVLGACFQFLFFIIIARAILSWVNPDPYNPLVRFIWGIAEPVLRPFKKLVRSGEWGLDLSPIFALLAIMFMQAFLTKTINDYGVAIKNRHSIDNNPVEEFQNYTGKMTL
ncbi:MAG TPA: YggT family protein [Oligoflexia bacterium]|nr:YggT family protein [Oligoflexia bacterium]HMP26720.1 YggT family protein [Oligoflexia bacterium]